MLFQLNFKSGKPVYLQVVDQVKAAAASGALRPGDPAAMTDVFSLILAHLER